MKCQGKAILIGLFAAVLCCGGSRPFDESVFNSHPLELKQIFHHMIDYCDRNLITADDYLVTAIFAFPYLIPPNVRVFWNVKTEDPDYGCGDGWRVVIRFDSITPGKNSFCIILPMPPREDLRGVNTIDLRNNAAAKIPKALFGNAEKPWQPILLALNRAIKELRALNQDTRNICGIKLLYDRRIYDDENFFARHAIPDMVWFIESAPTFSLSQWRTGTRDGDVYLVVDPRTGELVKTIGCR